MNPNSEVGGVEGNNHDTTDALPPSYDEYIRSSKVNDKIPLIHQGIHINFYLIFFKYITHSNKKFLLFF